MYPRGRKKTSEDGPTPGPFRFADRIFDIEYEPETIKPVPKPQHPRSVRFMRCLQARELGIAHDPSFRERVLREKVADYRKKKTCHFSFNTDAVYTGYFFRPGETFVVGAWFVQLNNMMVNAVGILHYDLIKVPARTKYIALNSSVTDACQLTLDDCFVCVTAQGIRSTGGEVHIAVPRPNPESGFSLITFVHPHEKPFLSVSANCFTQEIVAASDETLCIYSFEGLLEEKEIKNSIHSLAVNKIGNAFLAGCDTGELMTFDHRTRNIVNRMKVDNKIIDDILIMSDENYCLVSGVTGCLCQVDRRTNSIVMKYPGHIRRRKKIPVSVNEKMKLLCSSGADDVTRIWCLTTGSLLHSFKAPTSYPARACFVHDSQTADIHLMQDNRIHVYNMMM